MNNSSCDPETGSCVCSRGWQGENCDKPCDEGFFGIGCKEVCPENTPGNYTMCYFEQLTYNLLFGVNNIGKYEGKTIGKVLEMNKNVREVNTNL